MRFHPLLLASLFATTAFAQTAPVASRLAAQNDLFEQQYQSDLKLSPELATQLGDYRYNDQLSDASIAGQVHSNDVNKAFLAKLQAISTNGFPEQDKLSHDLMLRSLQQRITDFGFKDWEMPVNQMGGAPTDLADLPLSVPLDSVKHYEDYIARLHQIPRVLSQTQDVMRAGMKDNLMPVKFLLEKIPAQIDGVLAEDPYLTPTKKFPASISPADQQRLTKEITDALNTQVFPAYKSFKAFLVNNYDPHGRTTLAITSLPNGQARYQNDIVSSTTTHLTANEVHEIGLKEVARIEAQMAAIAKQQGFADNASFQKSLSTNPKYKPTSAEQILDDYRHYIAQMQPKLKDLFTVIPAQPVTVEAIPAFQSAMATHYQEGTPDGKRPGRVVVATSDLAHRSLVGDESIAYHEGIPGHHMQISIALSLTNIPKFRTILFNSGYIEGWALYAEQLGKEVGFYQDPVSDYGRLSSELFRAMRLVVDTGIHEKGWTRDQVVEHLRTVGIDEPEVQSETDRYIAWPGQALSYKLGQLTILKLRARAKDQLGPKFDIRTFDDEVLSGGVLPLDVLEARIDNWIAAQKSH
ncbi:DUF885 domain-containing protein [Granulicella paludicola]|uniref:DUF885 domain-containing protein n=1 Tax=Granulicella paludicola TaxID=474951 RepID=UPI0021E0A480|nr:DUF885 domain-containing protein [Granulicella paludicola]